MADAGANARSRAEAKKKIRDAERLLRKGGLPADVRAEVERKLKAHRAMLEEQVDTVAQRRVSAKYKMVRFFDRQKATRAAAKAAKARKAAEAAADEAAFTAADDQLVAARADLFYTVNFPLGFKYLALYPSTPDGNPAAPELRQRIRASLQERLRSGDIDDPTAVIDGGDAGIRTLLAAVQPPPGPKRPQPAAAGTSTAAAAAAAKKKAAPSPGAPAAAHTPAAPAAAHTPAAPSSTKRAREEDAHADHDDAAESPAAADKKKKKQKKEKQEPVADAEETLDAEPAEAAGEDGADDFFATEPVLPKRRVKEYRVNDGGHHPEQTSRRGWLKQQREDRALLAEKGGIIKRQRKDFLRGGDLPEDRKSLLAGRPVHSAEKALHKRFDD